MKKMFLFFSIICSAIVVMAQDSEPFLTKPLNKELIKLVKAETSGGGITVTAVNASEARVEVYIRPNNSITGLSKEAIQVRLNENYDLNIGVDGNTLSAIAKPKYHNINWKKALNISFKIFVEK